MQALASRTAWHPPASSWLTFNSHEQPETITMYDTTEKKLKHKKTQELGKNIYTNQYLYELQSQN